ncbi:MAG: hypothetical protein JWQ47_2260 [Glaciihabitans sp.]|nr:hypothetical protein [Glaciihabitans sp.]
MTSQTAPAHTASGIDPVGYHDLDGKPGFKLALQVVDAHWYLYVTHFWEPRLSVLDVTDPAAMELVGSIVGPDDTATWQVQVADRTIVQGLEARPPSWGGDPERPGDEGLRIWDASDPAHPELLGQWKTGAPDGVHRNHYTGGRYVHVAAARNGFEGNIYVILDIADPRNPIEVGSWHLPEQEAGHGTGARISFHGPAYVDGDRAYLGYGAGGLVILDISDLTAPRLVSRLEFGAALSSMIALHTAIPLPYRRLVLVNTEAIAEEQQEPYNFAGIVDVADETKPRLVSMLPIPVPAPGAPYPNFSTRGGRFGPHNQHHPQGRELFHSDDLLFMTWFNAGLRVYDIRDAYLPREIAWYLPDDPTERRGVLPRTLVTQSEDVLVDARGNIFFTDKNHGVHAVRLAAGVTPH